MNEKRYLDEVSFLRPILIILLVLYHAFIIYDGGWKEPAGFMDIPAYKWVAKCSFAIMLEMFVFISGYLWAYQRETLSKKQSFLQTIVNKFNRLIIPCLVFSALYLILLNRDNQLKISVLGALEGVGHLWFLPMLFWCFVFGYAIIHIKIKIVWKLIVLCAVAALSILPLPFRIGTSFQYLLFFMGGYYAWIYKEKIAQKLKSKRILLWIIFVILFVCLSLIEEKLSTVLLVERTDMVSKAVYLESKVYMRLLFSSIGVLALYLTAVQFTKKQPLNKAYVELGKYCMGVYVFQQFILQYLYYHTALPQTVGFMSLPWISFGIALLSSLLLTYTVKSL